MCLLLPSPHALAKVCVVTPAPALYTPSGDWAFIQFDSRRGTAYVPLGVTVLVAGAFVRVAGLGLPVVSLWRVFWAP